jgi:hypothetical protein
MCLLPKLVRSGERGSAPPGPVQVKHQNPLNLYSGSHRASTPLVLAVCQERKCGQMRLALRVIMVLFGTFGYIAMGIVLTGTG